MDEGDQANLKKLWVSAHISCDIAPADLFTSSRRVVPSGLAKKRLRRQINRMFKWRSTILCAKSARKYGLVCLCLTFSMVTNNSLDWQTLEEGRYRKTRPRPRPANNGGHLAHDFASFLSAGCSRGLLGRLPDRSRPGLSRLLQHLPRFRQEDHSGFASCQASKVTLLIRPRVAPTLT